MITKQKNHKQSWARHWKGALVPMIRSTPISLSLFVSYLKNMFLQMKKDVFKNLRKPRCALIVLFSNISIAAVKSWQTKLCNLSCNNNRLPLSSTYF